MFCLQICIRRCILGIIINNGNLRNTSLLMCRWTPVSFSSSSLLPSLIWADSQFYSHSFLFFFSSSLSHLGGFPVLFSPTFFFVSLSLFSLFSLYIAGCCNPTTTREDCLYTASEPGSTTALLPISPRSARISALLLPCCHLRQGVPGYSRSFHANAG